MDRTFPFDEHATCDWCGATGAVDIMGDELCPACVEDASAGGLSEPPPPPPAPLPRKRAKKPLTARTQG